MSIYPKPTTNTDVFNTKDYLDLGEEENSTDEIDDIDHSVYVTKQGNSTISGSLTVQGIQYFDSTTQTTAFNDHMKNTLNNLTYDVNNTTTTVIKNDAKINGVAYFNDNSFIGDVNNKLLIKTNDNNDITIDSGYNHEIELSSNNIKLGRPSTSTIHFNGETMQNAYTNDDHDFIDSIKDAIEIEPTSNNVKFNTNVIFDDDSIQTTAFNDNMKNILNNLTYDVNDDFVINTNDLNDLILDSGFAHHIDLKSSHINLSRSSTPAYIKFHNNMYINSVNLDLIISTGTSNKTIFDNDVSFNSDVVCNSITVNDEIQTNAFLQSHKDDIILTKAKINNFTFNGNNIDTTNKQLIAPSIQFPDGSIQTTAYTEDGGVLDLISNTNNVLDVTAELINLTDDFNNSYGQIGKNNNIQVELKSNNAQGISLNCGESAGVNIIGNSLSFDGNSGNSIIMNGETQDRCFTESLYQKIVNNPRISAHSNTIGWQFLNLSSAFAHSQRQETIIKTNIGLKLANINLDPAQFFFQTNGNWNQGEMLLQFKYGVNYKLTDCQITRLKSRIIIEGGTTFYTSLWTGIHYKDGFWRSEEQYINYGDSVIINMTDGAKLFIETNYDIQTSTTASGNFDLDCNIEIVQL